MYHYNNKIIKVCNTQQHCGTRAKQYLPTKRLSNLSLIGFVVSLRLYQLIDFNLKLQIL